MELKADIRRVINEIQPQYRIFLMQIFFPHMNPTILLGQRRNKV